MASYHLNYINIRTADLEGTRDFYAKVFGLEYGDRFGSNQVEEPRQKHHSFLNQAAPRAPRGAIPYMGEPR